MKQTVVKQLLCGLNLKWVLHLCTQSPHFSVAVQPPWCSQLPQLASKFRFFLPAAVIEFPFSQMLLFGEVSPERMAASCVLM